MKSDQAIERQIYPRRRRSSKQFSIQNLSAFEHIRIQNHLARLFLAELLGTFIQCSLGLSASAQNTFTQIEKPFLSSGQTVTVVFAIGGGLAILVLGKVSGAQINPSVSFSMFIIGRLTLSEFLIYLVAQLCGAFLAAGAVFLVYLDSFKIYPNGTYSLETAAVFSAYPVDHLTTPMAILDSMLATFILIWVVQALNDKQNEEHPSGVTILLITITLISIPCAFGYNSGALINPARDFGPRLFTWIAGWGNQVMTSHNYFFWIPLVGPILGSFVATLIYIVFISNNWE